MHILNTHRAHTAIWIKYPKIRFCPGMTIQVVISVGYCDAEKPFQLLTIKILNDWLTREKIELLQESYSTENNLTAV